MKTAKDWRRPCIDSVDRIKQIQLDAMKEGARRAAESLDIMVGEPVTTSERARKLCYNAILSTAANWTEKDL